ncbi:MAG: hypothetical protein WCY29_00615 [Novosphingobium sp.]
MELPTIDFAACEGHAQIAGWTEERRVRFLSRLAECGNVRASAAGCGLSPQSAYKLRRRDTLFARAWRAAVLLARDHSAQVLADRALDGVEEPIFYRGEQVGVRRRYDARLLLAHMARLDRLAEDAAAADNAAGDANGDADRFDELLALIAGEAPPEAMAGEDPYLPRTLEQHAAEAGFEAREARRAELPSERSRAGQDARAAAIEAAVEAACIAAECEWSAWFDRACVAVDRCDARALSFRARTVSTASTAGLAAAEVMRPGLG